MSQDSSTISLIQLALDASLMRQTAIAHNIANSNSRDYQTIEVNFEQQFFEQPVNEASAFDIEEQSISAPVFQQAAGQSSIDEQMALNVENMTHYRALIKGLNQKFAIMNLALQGTNQ